MSKTKTKSPYSTTYHRDGSITVWDVYSQSWLRTSDPSDQILASLNDDERRKIYRHCGLHAVILGRPVQHDHSGVGHCWVTIHADDLPVSIREEIECEMIDGDKDHCRDYVASNGQRYRW